MLPDRKSIVANIIHVCDLSIIFQFPNVFSSSIFLHLCYRYRLAMDESKSELNVRCCAEYNAKQVLIKIKTLIQVVNKSN
jgi:ABC-type phosphate transport system ATPase subunit